MSMSRSKTFIFL